MKRQKLSVKQDVSSCQPSVSINFILRFVIKPVPAVSIASVISAMFMGASYAFNVYQDQQAKSLACPADVRTALEHKRYPNEPIDQLFWQDNPEYKGMKFSQGIPTGKLAGWHSSKQRIQICQTALAAKLSLRLISFKPQISFGK
jgi:hypothetical protein